MSDEGGKFYYNSEKWKGSEELSPGQVEGPVLAGMKRDEKYKQDLSRMSLWSI